VNGRVMKFRGTD